MTYNIYELTSLTYRDHKDLLVKDIEIPTGKQAINDNKPFER